MNAVVWTDVIQSIFLITAVTSLCIFGITSLGGFQEISMALERGDRLTFNKLYILLVIVFNDFSSYLPLQIWKFRYFFSNASSRFIYWGIFRLHSLPRFFATHLSKNSILQRHEAIEKVRWRR